MNAEVVYQVAKSLPIEEQRELLVMLQKEISISSKTIKNQRQSILTKEIAFEYLIKNVFRKKE
ncbi:hypothetical protein [Urechidicola vernalis]|uniref:Uncharacterized protein n=1 Tax=Urechidicola vernalis TaxID=3075600 RepID=A0ABU2Y1S0_9FLAO|nr:hypothetical protein [Urechidicola sp. P050]MDT0552091.1 hypothetical protein [Urechidicola sp. P050]